MVSDKTIQKALRFHKTQDTQNPLAHSERRPQNIYSEEEKPLFYHQIGNTNFFIFIINH